MVAPFLMFGSISCLYSWPLEFVRGQDHDQVGSSDGRGNVGHFQAVGFCLGNGGRTFTQTDGDIHTGVLQVARLSVATGTVTDDGDFLTWMMERSQSLS